MLLHVRSRAKLKCGNQHFKTSPSSSPSSSAKLLISSFAASVVSLLRDPASRPNEEDVKPCAVRTQNGVFGHEYDSDLEFLENRPAQCEGMAADDDDDDDSGASEAKFDFAKLCEIGILCASESLLSRGFFACLRVFSFEAAAIK